MLTIRQLMKLQSDPRSNASQSESSERLKQFVWGTEMRETGWF
jgi:hypothetical protein